MNLYIALNVASDDIVYAEKSLFHMETMSIAGKELVQYWLEWARFQGYEKLYISSANAGLDDEKIQDYQDLYGIEVIYKKAFEKMDKAAEEVYAGIGIFLDSGEYKCFKDLSDLMIFEQELIYNPLKYCALYGYGKSGDIQIGKNVYMHKSVKLSGAVVIGDNCIIEKDVEIKDSVINSDCFIKEKCIIKNSHVAKYISLASGLYLKDKALFEISIYDMVSKQSVVHDGICLKN